MHAPNTVFLTVNFQYFVVAYLYHHTELTYLKCLAVSMQCKIHVAIFIISPFTQSNQRGWASWCFRLHFQQYVTYIMAVSLIGGGNRSIRRKPPQVTGKLHNIKLVSSTLHNDNDKRNVSMVICDSVIP